MVKSEVVNSPHNREFMSGTFLFDHFRSRRVLRSKQRARERRVGFLLDSKVKHCKSECPKKL